MNQKDKVIKRVKEIGYVDNFWAVQNYMLRLGAIIFSLKEDGWEFKGNFGRGAMKKNFYYYPTKRPDLNAAVVAKINAMEPKKVVDVQKPLL